MGGMSQLQHDETETILFHRKYYFDSATILDYLIVNNDKSIILKICAPCAGGLGLLRAGDGEWNGENFTLRS